MQPGLVREGGRTDVGLSGAPWHVGQLADVVRDLRQHLHLCVADDVDSHLELEVGADAEHVGVAAHIAVAVRRALYLRCARLHGHQRVGDRHVGAVVCVYPHLARHLGHDQPHDLADLRRHRAPIRVAERDAICAGFGGRLQALQRVGFVGGESVEKVLGVEEGGEALALEEAKRVRQHRQVLLGRRLQDLRDVLVAGLADERDDGCSRFEQRAQVGVALGLPAGLARRAERRQPGVAQVQLARPSEERGVFGV